MSFFRLGAVLLFIVLAIGTYSSAQPVGQQRALEVGGSLGMQEFQTTYIGTFGFFIEIGDRQGLQLHFGFNSGLFNSVVVTNLESMFVLNFAQKFYTGAGISVPMIIGQFSGELPLQIVGIFGVKSPIAKNFNAQIEGGVLIPISGNGKLTFRGALIGIFPF
ncbi:hypothetical protein HY229_01050 [Candidatus Acetothermia bacterium]|nr:hypothetical protein [Candidatus Acetothermia bacterium]MBI3642678.1 hypothetical protein [Candidatus Acetothermia bacterium]